MNRALESEWLEDVQEVQEAQAQEAREVEGLDREEERHFTFLGQDPLYQHLMWQMVNEYYNHMHEEMVRCYPSPYVQTQEEVQEGVDIPNQVATENPEAKAGRSRETGTQTTMVDA